MGIHYDYKSTKSAKLMEKQAKREKNLLKERQKDKLKKEQKNFKKFRKNIRHVETYHTRFYHESRQRMNNKHKLEKLSLALRKNLKKKKIFQKKNKKNK